MEALTINAVCLGFAAAFAILLAFWLGCEWGTLNTERRMGMREEPEVVLKEAPVPKKRDSSDDPWEVVA